MGDIAARQAETDAFGKVETHGIEAIPTHERHGQPRELAFLWGGAFVNYASLFTASLLTTYYGLGVWDGLAATAIGTVAAAVILGLLSNTGPRSGLPQIVFTRRIFGNRGAYPGAVLTLFLGVGWFAVDTVIAALAGVQLLQVAGIRADVAGKFLFPWVLVIAAASVAVAVYGHRRSKFSRLSARWGSRGSHYCCSRFSPARCTGPPAPRWQGMITSGRSCSA